MTADDAGDSVLRDLGRLPPAAPDVVRSARVRGRCHAVLARQRRQDAADRRVASVKDRVFELALVGGLCVVYLSAVIERALEIRGVF